ncbi:MAG: MnhB domain-containing protein [Bacillota bacterium]
MKNSEILSVIGKILFPFILLLGFYIIFNGDISPGGGFQGGTILATAFLTIYLVKSNNLLNTKLLIKVEKILFILILAVSAISFFTRGKLFTNFIPLYYDPYPKRMFLILLNILIGLKVASGLIAVFTSFIDEFEYTDETADNEQH